MHFDIWNNLTGCNIFTCDVWNCKRQSCYWHSVSNNATHEYKIERKSDAR